MPNLNINAIEHAIRQLPAVHAVRVALEEHTGEIAKVHVLASPGRAPKKVVRDIESLFMLRFNRRLDYRKISLIHGRPSDFEPFLRPRLRLIAVEMRIVDDRYRVMISLEDDEMTHLGTAESSSIKELPLIAVEATLDALKSSLSDTPLMDAVVKLVSLDGERVALVAVITKGKDGGCQEKLLGSAFIQEEEEEILTASVRATLDAVNRRFFKG